MGYRNARNVTQLLKKEIDNEASKGTEKIDEWSTLKWPKRERRVVACAIATSFSFGHAAISMSYMIIAT